MVWPSKALGSLYSTLYCDYDGRVFSLDDVASLVGSRPRAKVYLHRLRRGGWAFPFSREGRGMYRLQRPEVSVLTECGKIRGLTNVKQQEYAGLLGTFAAEVIGSVGGVKSLVLFGSLARGKARSDSDVDLIAVIENKDTVRSAFGAMTELEQEGRTADELKYLASRGIFTHLSVLPMSASHLSTHPFILLDAVEDGLLICDDGTFESEASKMKRGLERLGARRVFLGEENWYWDLIPRYSKGMSVEI